MSIKYFSEIRLEDSVEFRLGTGGDAHAVHNGSNFFLVNDTGDLTIKNSANDKDIIFQCDDGSGGDETYLFLDGSNNFTQSLKHIRFVDNASVLVGSSSDLSITHNGTNSVIANSTGNLQINQNVDDGDLILQCDNGSGGTTAYITLDGSAGTVEIAKATNFADDITCGDDLFMPNAGVINFNSGDVTVTHAANQLTVAGGSLFFNFGNGNYNTVDGTAFLDSEDNELMSFTEGIVNFPAAVTVAGDITHTGDGDTKISFGTDTITFTCGNTAIYTLGSSSATMAGILDITNTTDSSDATGDTGALRCEGGASIAKKLFVGSAITGSNDVIAFSDRKLKDNIETLDGKKVLDMRGVSFTRKDTGKESSGVIAQEIQEVAPELVHDTNGTLGVAYGNLVGYLIEAIKDQQKQIDELRQNCNGCSK